MVTVPLPQTKQLLCSKTGESIALDRRIANSGEGEVWTTSQPGSLAKIYHVPTEERVRKLQVMVAHPPQDPNAQISHVSYAWPQSLLLNAQGRCVGFLMPAILASVELMDVYHPSRRQKVCPEFTWMHLHVIAANVASLIWAIHHAGYVMGDIKPQNILVNSAALPALIDTDSFQVRDPASAALYRCLVGSESFTPPELLGQDLATVEQTPLHDRFRLGVIIYQLLFGEHPFKGKWVGPGDSPSPTDLVRLGFWPYTPKSLIQPGPLTMPLAIVHSEVQQCFFRCFALGHINPEQRPTAQEWVRVLKVAIADLKVCSRVKQHYYSTAYGHCNWCDRQAALGVDIFPAPIPPTPKAIQYLQRQASRGQRLINKGQVLLKRSPHTMSPPTRLTSIPSQMAAQPLVNPMRQPQGSAVNVKLLLQSLLANGKPFLQTRWSRFVGAMSLGSGLLVSLVLLSQSYIEPENLGSTLVGSSLCMGLVALCFLLPRNQSL
jgi:DNA-binding helix-hairpin-helix protein with protein kinase domain